MIRRGDPGCGSSTSRSNRRVRGRLHYLPTMPCNVPGRRTAWVFTRPSAHTTRPLTVTPALATTYPTASTRPGTYACYRSVPPPHAGDRPPDSRQSAGELTTSVFIQCGNGNTEFNVGSTAMTELRGLCHPDACGDDDCLADSLTVMCAVAIVCCCFHDQILCTSRGLSETTGLGKGVVLIRLPVGGASRASGHYGRARAGPACY